MIYLYLQGEITFSILAIMIIGIIISITFHEFGHAWTAKKFGDNTAERMGRVTLNPISHVDPMGLIMILLIGIGYGRPVPTDPRNFNSPQASLWISAAGPAMNLILAFLSINVLAFGFLNQIDFLTDAGPKAFLQYMAFINLILMIFNLLPIGALDGHYILPYFLSKRSAYKYNQLNDQYGNMLLFGLLALSLIGVPIFSFLLNAVRTITQYLIIF